MLESLRKQLLRAMAFLLRAFHVSSSTGKPEAAPQPTPSEVSAVPTGYPELEERFSTAAGLYVTDLALIRLSRDESYWAEGNEPTLRRLAVFVHEYAHYLHNFSTVTGIYGFVTSMRRLRLFANTVPAEGRSEGSQVLKPDELLEFQGTMQLRNHMAGDLRVDPAIHREARRGFEILGWDFETLRVSLVNQQLDLKRVKVRLRAGSPDASLESEFWLGAHVLSESLAWEMERILFEVQGENLALLDTAAVWPYQFARRLLEQAVGTPVDSQVVAKLVLLALQSTDPGVAFVELAGMVAGRGEKPIAEVIDGVTAQTVEWLAKAKDAMIASLRQELVPFASRPALSRAFGALMQSAIELIELRLQRPVFEIEALLPPDGSGVVKLIKSLPPCPIIQETEMGEEIFYLLDRQPDRLASISLGVTQSALQFAAPHYRPDKIFPTSELGLVRCKFFGSCRAPQTTSMPDRCTQRPWDSFDPASAEQCWYGQGVAVVRARNQAHDADAK